MKRILCNCLLLLLGGLPALGTVNGQDTICGPRCVKYIVDYFGRPSVFLSDLVVAIQGKDYRQNLASFEDLETELVKHGVYARLVKLESPEYAATKGWSGPIVLHQDCSHFVLLLPAGSDETVRLRIWDGLRGLREISRSKTGEPFSEHVLLTSDKPITDEVLEKFNRDVYQRNRWRRDRRMTYVALILIGAAGIFATHRSMRKAGPESQVSKQDSANA